MLINEAFFNRFITALHSDYERTYNSRTTEIQAGSQVIRVTSYTIDNELICYRHFVIDELYYIEPEHHITELPVAQQLYKAFGQKEAKARTEA